MKLKPEPNCTLCHTEEIDRFYHMIWECPGVVYFWNMVQVNLSTILNVLVTLSPSVFILKYIQLNKMF